jgi:hypothetical protein
MNEATARAIILEYFTRPDFDQVGFLKQKQKESERTPTIFIQYILDAFKYYFDLLGSNVNKARAEGNDVNDWGIPLWQLAPKIYLPGTGHLYFSQMPEYWEGIKQFMAEINEPENKGSQEKKIIKLPNPNTTKRELTDLTAIAIGLIHVFTGEPIDTDNMGEISERYKKPDGTFYKPRNLYNEYGLIPATEKERLRQKPTKTLINHYKRCIHWLNSKGIKHAENTANKELQELQNK